ncbi:MAG: hypothetical protein GZ091_18840 [Paludibacter sp.]|nr:hypothetical protein [Paludibacter sp.]
MSSGKLIKFLKTKAMAILSLSQPETISIGRKLGASFERDKADFQAHSSRFADPFGAEYVALNDEVEALPTVKGVNSELKKATARIKATLLILGSDIDKVENLINLTKEDLTIAKKDFGVRQVRAAISAVKEPELVTTMHNLMDNIKANIKPLTNIGLTSDLLTTIENRVKSVTAGEVLQSQIQGRRGQVAYNNSARYDDFQTMMKLILETGKTLYKRKNPTKLKDFILADLRRKHRASKNDQVPPDKDKSKDSEPT